VVSNKATLLEALMSRLALWGEGRYLGLRCQVLYECKLTMPEDKLIAISRPARKLLIVYGYCQSYGGTTSGRSISGHLIRRFAFDLSIIEHHHGVGKV
jgi:hypothetical protein